MSRAELPEVVAFDVVGTTFSLEALRRRLTDAGASGHLLETWFAQTLRDAFALDTVGIYQPFAAIAAATLRNLVRLDVEEVEHIVSGFAELDPHPDAETAMRRLRDAGARVVGLTNGSREVTEKLWRRAGLMELVERTVSVDEVGHWKPRREVYLHCADVVDVAPAQMALIAAHPWDIQGAHRAGLLTACVLRDAQVYPAVMEAPDVTADSLEAAARALLDPSHGTRKVRPAQSGRRSSLDH